MLYYHAWQVVRRWEAYTRASSQVVGNHLLFSPRSGPSVNAYSPQHPVQTRYQSLPCSVPTFYSKGSAVRFGLGFGLFCSVLFCFEFLLGITSPFGTCIVFATVLWLSADALEVSDTQ